MNIIFRIIQIEKNIFRIKILLASPGNLSKDRKKVYDIVKNINLDNGQREGFVAEIVSWETHTHPAAGEYPQAVINDQFPDDIDIFIGMMGTHFGTPTKYWGSGTEEEFRIAYKSWKNTKTPEIMFYFSDAMTSLNQIDPEQLLKRNNFQKELAQLGVYYFVYTDVTEFQFDLFRHISSSIRKVLSGKVVGESEEAIPQESSDNLKTYNELLAQDPLVNSSLIISKSATHMEAYGKILNAFNVDTKKLTRGLIKESNNLNRANQQQNLKKAQKSFNAMIDVMNEYTDSIVIKIPKLSMEFSASILSILRAVSIVRDNNLEEQLPLTDILNNVGDARKSLEFLITSINDAEKGFEDWPENILDLKIQKLKVIALHQDLVSSLSKAIELLDRLINECS